MKKTLLFTTISFLSLYFSQAQDVIQNFDSWTTASCGAGQPNYDDPNPTNYWASLNQLCNLGQPIITVTQTNDAITGTAAILRTQILGVANADSTPGFLARLIPGLVNSGELNTGSVNNPLIQGRPYTGRPSCFRGYYKYFPIQGDSAAISAEVTKNGVIVGKAAFAIYNTVNTYTMFDIPFVYNNTDTPDSINIVFASSAGALSNKGRKGSRLFIDEAGVYMSCPQSLEEEAPRFAQVYPNPANERLEIRMQSHIPSANLTVYNLQGEWVMSAQLLQSISEISLAALPVGYYTYKIQSFDGAENRGKIAIAR